MRGQQLGRLPTRWLAATLVAALACSAVPSPAYALRATGLEESKAKPEVERELQRGSPTSASPATPSPAAGMEEPVMLPPGGTNPFAGDVVQPNYVINLLLVYYTPKAETFAKSLAPTQRARAILEVPLRYSEMSDYSVMITASGEVPEADKAALRTRHIAVIERRDGMTIEQVIQEAIAQWEGRSAEEIGQVARVIYRDGRLGIYL